MKDINN